MGTDTLLILGQTELLLQSQYLDSHDLSLALLVAGLLFFCGISLADHDGASLLEVLQGGVQEGHARMVGLLVQCWPRRTFRRPRSGAGPTQTNTISAGKLWATMIGSARTTPQTRVAPSLQHFCCSLPLVDLGFSLIKWYSLIRSSRSKTQFCRGVDVTVQSGWQSRGHVTTRAHTRLLINATTRPTT